MEEKEIIIAVFFIAFALLGTGAFSILLFLLFKRKEFINQQKIASLNKAILTSRLEVQEKTLKDISSELHDNIGQSLALVSLHINSVHCDEADAGKLHQAGELLQNVLTGIRDISKNIKGEKVISEGLINSLKRELHIIETTGRYKVNFSTNEDTFDLSDDHLIIVFRIIQESLHNILKHARATEISVDLVYSFNKLNITIRDNGVGFLAKSNDDGLGIQNMKERAALMNANLTIDSQLNKGTEIHIEIPRNHVNKK